MPDRTRVKVGDLVYASFFDGCFSHFFGEVQKEIEREDGRFFIQCGDNIGYFDNAYAVWKAVEFRGNLCIAPGILGHKKDRQLWLMPIHKDGTINPEESYKAEPSKISNRDADQLYEIAEKLGGVL